MAKTAEKIDIALAEVCGLDVLF